MNCWPVARLAPAAGLFRSGRAAGADRAEHESGIDATERFLLPYLRAPNRCRLVSDFRRTLVTHCRAHCKYLYRLNIVRIAGENWSAANSCTFPSSRR